MEALVCDAQPAQLPLNESRRTTDIGSTSVSSGPSVAVWAQRCGQEAADAFCLANGFAAADSFAEEFDIGLVNPTQLIGSGEICDQAFCDGSRYITCRRDVTGTAAAPSAPAAPTPIPAPVPLPAEGGYWQFVRMDEVELSPPYPNATWTDSVPGRGVGASSFVASFKDEGLPDGRQRVVHHRTSPAQTILTGIGPIPVERQEVRDRATHMPAKMKIRLSRKRRKPLVERAYGHERVSHHVASKRKRHGGLLGEYIRGWANFYSKNSYVWRRDSPKVVACSYTKSLNYWNFMF